MTYKITPFKETVISLYYNSNNINIIGGRLIEVLQSYCDNLTYLENQNGVQAEGYWLDLLSARFNVPRYTIQDENDPSTGSPISDELQVQYLKAKISGLVSNSSKKSFQEVLKSIFGENSIIIETGLMEVIFIIDTDLTTQEIQIMVNSEILPKATGVRYGFIQKAGEYFGFDGDDTAVNFGNGSFAPTVNY